MKLILMIAMVCLLLNSIASAAIVTSEIISSDVQGSKRHVNEKHVDHLGKEYFRFYKCPVGFDTAARLVSHASELWVTLVALEKQEYLSRVKNGVLSDVPLSPNYATIPAMKKHLIRQGFILAGQVSAIAVIPLIDSLSDANIRTTVDITQARVDQIRSRVTALKSIDIAIVNDKTNIINEEEDI